MNTERRRTARRRSEAGFTILETVIAAFILVILAVSIVSAGLRSRRNIDYEETRRQAIAIGQEHLESLRAQADYDTVADRDFTVSLVDPPRTLTFDVRSRVTQGYDPINPDSLDDFVKFVTDEVLWTARGWNAGQTARRKIVMSTYLFRGL